MESFLNVLCIEVNDFRGMAPIHLELAQLALSLMIKVKASPEFLNIPSNELINREVSKKALYLWKPFSKSNQEPEFITELKGRILSIANSIIDGTIDNT